MTHFDHLRRNPWNPTFVWVKTVEDAAALINVWHEDYPVRVERTENVLRALGTPPPIAVPHLLAIHKLIFGDTSHGGSLRNIHVIVGQHRPPVVEEVPQLMQELEDAYLGKLTDIETLIAWYSDFETIHPFQDGNGRVGGVCVAVYGHHLEPEKGYLAPNQ